LRGAFAATALIVKDKYRSREGLESNSFVFATILFAGQLDRVGLQSYIPVRSRVCIWLLQASAIIDSMITDSVRQEKRAEAETINPCRG
jgi:hypothetical protein